MASEFRLKGAFIWLDDDGSVNIQVGKLVIEDTMILGQDQGPIIVGGPQPTGGPILVHLPAHTFAETGLAED